MKYRHLIFDFDGVLVESNEIRFAGFKLLFQDYPAGPVERFMQYARSNGGISRYEKIRYFFERVYKTAPISDNEVTRLAMKYSELVKQQVIEAPPVNGAMEFLSQHAAGYDFAIVSGSDQEELREICRTRGIDRFFDEILGSPESKESNLSLLLSRTGWERAACLFIGDSLNDLDAAQLNKMDFIGRSSGLVNWDRMGDVAAIHDFTELPLYLLQLSG
ncbi:MAG: HAD-IA family hydrolase [Nitrospirota bacterium]|nr:HAD-IA family hydrolase [Nitrospirota bacterium]